MLNLLKRTFTKKNVYYGIPYKLLNKEQLKKKVKVTVVMPVFNAMDYLERAIDSVIDQTMNVDTITLILVDDGSTDESQSIMEKYSTMHSNIVSVFLSENTGTPALPRNLGTYLAQSTYIMYLDSDDWLAREGVSTLYELMEETGVNFSVGKTIRVGTKKQAIVGKHESNKVRKKVSPYSIQHMFHHLSPCGRMVKLDVIKDHDLTFPDMKYAEDKQFFIDVLLHSPEISTTTTPIYYINRDEENVSLTKRTDTLEKMHTNVEVLKYVMDKNLPEAKERRIVNRIIEFDCTTRLFDRQHFLESEEKDLYFDIYSKVINTFFSYQRSYSLEDSFIKPINRLIFQLFVENRYEDLIALIQWSKEEKDKTVMYEDHLPYYSIKNGELTLPIPFLFKSTEVDLFNSAVKLTVQMEGHSIPAFQQIKLQNRKVIEDIQYIDLHVNVLEAGKIEIYFNIADLESLAEATYAFYLMYEDYKQTLLPFLHKEELLLTISNDQEILAYSTVKDNFSIKVRQRG
ncbi:glycosyltransferase [Fictibacillus macauensis ZFHKF-1]|uniref:Glycosyltransferase n=1 Tax=Fictibacillus macauensis ZFHKF-1 TaxID=1196324 RepID=I8UCT1_9BACL|nr:glycosyltransferase family 2 protein [Fictibacillus macauensis]EIT84730.1 glycosyltransferase [Fictibacillus macauensis ZFHKF-1]